MQLLQSYIEDIKEELSVEEKNNIIKNAQNRFLYIHPYMTFGKDVIKDGDGTAKYESSKPYLWGVICGNAKDITHIEMTIRIAENEDFIVNRLEREKRNGHVYKINNHQYKYVVDTYDAMELMPWIRTFIGRIENLESSNSYLKEKFNEDMKKMYSMYLGGDDHAI